MNQFCLTQVFISSSNWISRFSSSVSTDFSGAVLNFFLGGLCVLNKSAAKVTCLSRKICWSHTRQPDRLFFQALHFFFFVIKMMHACWHVILVFLVFKAWLSLQVHNNSHLYHHGNIGNSQTLSGICWKSSGKGESNTSTLLCFDLRFYTWECYCPLKWL